MDKIRQNAKLTDQEFLQWWDYAREQGWGSQRLADELDMDRRSMMKRRRRLEDRYGHIPGLGQRSSLNISQENRLVWYDHPYTVAIASDCHWWPNVPSPATNIFLDVLEDTQPDVVIMNGDIFDGAAISRHPRIGWEERPSPVEELHIVQEWMELIREATPDADHLATWGNHCQRFNDYFSKQAPEMDGIPGTCITDHIEGWEWSMSISLNDACMVKHRFKGGQHAAYNNTLHAGLSMVTGHTHRLVARRLRDYSGMRWGLECGTLCDPDGPQGRYTEDSPADVHQGFAMLHVDGSEILPELVHVERGRAVYGGKKWAA